MHIYTCKHCGKEFKRYKRKPKPMYCSRSCAAKARVGKKQVKHERIIVQCLYCDEDISTTTDHKRCRKFCSSKCKSNYTTTKIDVYCIECGKLYKARASDLLKRNRSFCSTACYSSFHSRVIIGIHNKNTKGHTKLICKQCNTIFEVPNSVASKGRKFCVKACHSQWMRDNWQGKNHPTQRAKASKLQG